ncbi:MAG: HypC/HybG/HupF family hydrogenase formation chaperone [archaeon]
MCLAVPAKVIALKENGKKVLVEQQGIEREAINMAKAKKGDFVLLQQGFAVEKISEKEALEAIEAWNGNA